jgi:hypothetical protein
LLGQFTLKIVPVSPKNQIKAFSVNLLVYEKKRGAVSD